MQAKETNNYKYHQYNLSEVDKITMPHCLLLILRTPTFQRTHPPHHVHTIYNIYIPRH